VSLRAGSNFLSLDEFNYYFGGVNGETLVLTEEDKMKINDLFDGGGLVFTDASTNLFSASYNTDPVIGAFAFSVSDFISTNFTIPPSIVELTLSGNDLGKTYNLDEADAKGWWIRNYSLSYARELPTVFFEKLAAGITLKLVHGFFYMGTSRNSSYFITGNSAEISGEANFVGYSSFSDNFGVKYEFDSIFHKSNFSPLLAPAGKGFGLDLGIAASVNNNINISLAVTDLGQINWDKNVAEFFSLGNVYIDDLTDSAQINSAEETLKGTSKKIDHIYTGTATALRFGVSYIINDSLTKFPGSLLLAFDYNQGFNYMPGNSPEPRFSIGTEWKPMEYFPYLRTGFSYGGGRGFYWAFGLGIDAGLIDFHFATTDMQSVFAPNSSKTFSFSLSSRWKF
jgi:hypothetical protein